MPFRSILRSNILKYFLEKASRKHIRTKNTDDSQKTNGHLFNDTNFPVQTAVTISKSPKLQSPNTQKKPHYHCRCTECVRKKDGSLI